MTVKILNRYLSKEILKFFMMMLIIVIAIFITVDYIGTMDNFLRSGISLYRAFLWVLMRVPFIVVQIIPAVLLLAVLVVFGLMNRNYEIVAIKSSGVSIYFLLRTTLMIGLLMGIVLVLLSEVVVPITHYKTNKIEQVEIRKRSYATSKKKDIWIKGNRTITYIKFIKPMDTTIIQQADLTIFGIIHTRFDEKFRLIKRVDAQKGIYLNGKWILYDLIEQTRDKTTGNYKAAFFEEKPEDLNILPEDLTRVMKKPDEMSFPELLNFIKTIEAEGYDATTYRVGLYAKTAYPFACIIMCIIAIGIAGKTTRQIDLPAIITYGILIGFFYWVSYNMFLSFGYGEKLPPVIAAWAANVIFLCFGGVMLSNVE